MHGLGENTLVSEYAQRCEMPFRVPAVIGMSYLRQHVIRDVFGYSRQKEILVRLERVEEDAKHLEDPSTEELNLSNSTAIGKHQAN
jgi:hypothetical protein